jgi:heat shock protein HspQ
MEKDTRTAKFSIGQLVIHKLFNYRGVIIDVDPVFQGTDEWYEQMALSRPPRNSPWYHVLVHNAVHETYVAERNLLPDSSGQAVQHPLIDIVFDEFRNGVYIKKHQSN